MEKLISLLNERHNLERVLWSNINWDYLFVKWDKENKFYEENIISKKFWFIKWLVYGNKIDKDKVNKEFKNILTIRYFENEQVFLERDYLKLLMLLSIQDNPIDFLLSILL